MAEKFDERYRGRCWYIVLLTDLASNPDQTVMMEDELAKICVYQCKKGRRKDAERVGCYEYRERRPDCNDIVRTKEDGFISIDELMKRKGEGVK
jgi:hypothetical protein